MEPTQQPDFRHGYSSGIEGVNRDSYEGYLASQVNHDWLAGQISRKETEWQRVEQEIAQATHDRKSGFDQLQDHLLKMGVMGKRVGRLEADRDRLEADQAALRARRERSAPEYSLLAGLLFLVAGLAFLFGDLIISHEIVAYALNIRNNFEAWAFAVGLAMVSILLKPAYDRLIEQPYQQNPAQYRSKYERFKVALALFSVLTLAILGWFRYEAYRTDQTKAAINKSIRSLQQNAPVDAAGNQVLDATTLAKVEQQLRESDALNLNLVNSPMALLSFVLSGILFALAGAVCLGIALPVLQAYWFRWLQADIKLWKLRRRLRRVNRELGPLEQQFAEHVTCRNVLEHYLTMLPSLEDLRARRNQLRTDLDTLANDLRLAQTDQRIASYNDGYGKGEVAREQMSQEEYEQFQSGYFNLQNLASRARSASPEQRSGSPADVANGPRQANGRSLRPHQAIRRFIADDFNNDATP